MVGVGASDFWWLVVGGVAIDSEQRVVVCQLPGRFGTVRLRFRRRRLAVGSQGGC